MRNRFLSLFAIIALLVSSLAFAAPAGAATQLVGDSSVESFDDYVSTGFVEAFKYTATSTGVGITQYVYLTNADGHIPSTVKVGVYSNNGSNQPGTLLATCTISSPTANAWNHCSLAGQTLVITSSNTYWLAVMSPYLDWNPNYRATQGGTSGTNDYVTNTFGYTAMPSTFGSATGYDNSPASMYVETT